MPWYVFALVDAPPSGRLGPGLGGALTSQRVPGGFAIVERRADVPPLEFGTLEKHDRIVARLAENVPAILPVRFGTLLEIEQIEEVLDERAEELAEAFTVVRGRVQFTWRGAPGARAARSARPAKGAKGAVGAGAAYLRQVAQAAAPPAAFRLVRRDPLQRLTAAERYQPATRSLPDSLYHLVERTDAARYRSIAEALASPASTVHVTGPFPPFAFTPDLL